MPDKTNKYGGVIDLSTTPIAKAPRGAVKEFEPELLELMRSVTATIAIGVSFFTVARGDYAATDAGETEWKNERQRIGAVLRSHAIEAGIGKISINWHPEGDYPQVSLKGA
tara:strand:- start:1125 stop:1457 length:333 start_codon:yes stop_codon:yes gene_type:complete